MEKKKVTAESPVTVNGVTLTPLVETRIIEHGARYGTSFLAWKTMLALMTVNNGVKKVYRISGEEISPDELVKECPSIKEIVESP